MSKAQRKTQVQMFKSGEDLPLFSGTPQVVRLEVFRPQESATTPALPGFELVACDKTFHAEKKPLGDNNGQ